jgi:hypothetical protein
MVSPVAGLITGAVALALAPGAVDEELQLGLISHGPI